MLDVGCRLVRGPAQDNQYPKSNIRHPFFMTRRDLLSSLLAAPSAPVGYRNYSRCLPDFLRDLAQRAYQMRNRELAKLTTPAAIRARQQWVRETFWKLAGGMPEPTPLNARSLGSIERGG